MHRRDFLRGSAGVAAFFAPDAIDRARAATVGNSQPADDLAKDETFWRNVQEAFDVDRSIINFNNGGVCPSPRVVQNALKRGIDFANGAPAYAMWRVLEPE